jgi:PilZ domain
LRAETQRGNRPTSELLDARRRPRFKLEVDMRIYPRDCPVVQGHSVDISESGISAMLRVEVPVGAVVRLEFLLPLGNVEILAVVRHKNAFRYGFQFVEISSGQDVIGRTCRQLSVESALWECPSSVPPPG